MTPEQEALVENARNSITAAKLLAQNGFHNYAAARAYYAMFYLAEALLLIEGLTFSKHSGVIAKFGEYFVKTGRVPAVLHEYIRNGQRDRHKGDYDSLIKFTEVESGANIAHAEEFLQEALKLLAPPAEPK